MDLKSELHSILLEIRTRLDAGTLPMRPICHLVEEMAQEKRMPIKAYYALEAHLRGLLQWNLFPVREDPYTDPTISYLDYYGTYAMWDANHPYGASRRKLLADLIEQTKG